MIHSTRKFDDSSVFCAKEKNFKLGDGHRMQCSGSNDFAYAEEVLEVSAMLQLLEGLENAPIKVIS